MCSSSQLMEEAPTSIMSLLWLRKSLTLWPTKCTPVYETYHHCINWAKSLALRPSSLAWLTSIQLNSLLIPRKNGLIHITPWEEFPKPCLRTGWQCRVHYYRCSPKERDVIIQSRLTLGNIGLQERASCRALCYLYTISIPASQPKSPS